MVRTNTLFGIISEMKRMGSLRLLQADIGEDGTGTAVIENREGNPVSYNVKSGGMLELAE